MTKHVWTKHTLALIATLAASGLATAQTSPSNGSSTSPSDQNRIYRSPVAPGGYDDMDPTVPRMSGDVASQPTRGRHHPSGTRHHSRTKGKHSTKQSSDPSDADRINGTDGVNNTPNSTRNGGTTNNRPNSSGMNSSGTNAPGMNPSDSSSSNPSGSGDQARPR